MKKRVWTSLISAVLPGAGQMYYRHWAKGLGFLGAAMILSGMVRREMMGSAIPPLQWLPSPANVLLAHVVLLGLALWSAADAYLEGK